MQRYTILYCPVSIILTRQSVPILKSTQDSTDKVAKGAYILEQTNLLKQPDIILIATGSEVHLAVEAKKVLGNNVNVRIVSMPSWELFEDQDEKYKNKVFPQDVKSRISIEAGISQGWEKYTGKEGKSISVEKFGASAPGGVVMTKYGFNTKNVVKQANKLLNK